MAKEVYTIKSILNMLGGLQGTILEGIQICEKLPAYLEDQADAADIVILRDSLTHLGETAKEALKALDQIQEGYAESLRFQKSNSQLSDFGETTQLEKVEQVVKKVLEEEL
jgi:hypothetical protein